MLLSRPRGAQSCAKLIFRRDLGTDPLTLKLDSGYSEDVAKHQDEAQLPSHAVRIE